MTPADFNALPGGPPLPEEIDPTDPLGVERWLLNASVHAQRVTRSTKAVWYRGRRVRRPRFSKREQKRWQVNLSWPIVRVRFTYDEGLRFHLDLKPLRGAES